MSSRNHRLVVIIGFFLVLHGVFFLMGGASFLSGPSAIISGVNQRFQVRMVKRKETPKPKPRAQAVSQETVVETPDPPQESTVSDAVQDQVEMGTEGEVVDRYDAYVAQQIEAHKVYPVVARKKQWTGKVVVGFVLNSMGELVSSAVLRESRFSLLDHAALDAVQKAAPFPPFPTQVTEPTRAYQVEVVFTLN